MHVRACQWHAWVGACVCVCSVVWVCVRACVRACMRARARVCLLQFDVAKTGEIFSLMNGEC